MPQENLKLSYKTILFTVGRAPPPCDYLADYVESENTSLFSHLHPHPTTNKFGVGATFRSHKKKDTRFGACFKANVTFFSKCSAVDYTWPFLTVLSYGLCHLRNTAMDKETP